MKELIALILVAVGIGFIWDAFTKYSKSKLEKQFKLRSLNRENELIALDEKINTFPKLIETEQLKHTYRR